MKIKLVVLDVGFDMMFLVGFKRPPIHEIYFEILPVHNRKRLRTTDLSDPIDNNALFKVHKDVPFRFFAVVYANVNNIVMFCIDYRYLQST